MGKIHLVDEVLWEILQMSVGVTNKSLCQNSQSRNFSAPIMLKNRSCHETCVFPKYINLPLIKLYRMSAKIKKVKIGSKLFSLNFDEKSHYSNKHKTYYGNKSSITYIHRM